MSAIKAGAALALILLLSASTAQADRDDHEELECGPFGDAHGDHCDCKKGYAYEEGKGCVEEEDAHEDDHHHEHVNEHNEGRPDWPDCECIVPDIDCTAAGSRAIAALARLKSLNCTKNCAKSDDCMAAFFLVNALHDGCPDGSVSTDAEVAYHRYAEACPNCHVLAKSLTSPKGNDHDDEHGGDHDDEDGDDHDDEDGDDHDDEDGDDHGDEHDDHQLPLCPDVSCNDTALADDAFAVLLMDCAKSCAGNACEEAWSFALGFHALCPESLTFEQGELFHLLDDLCEHECEVLHTREANCSSDANERYAHLTPLFADMEELLAASDSP